MDLYERLQGDRLASVNVILAKWKLPPLEAGQPLHRALGIKQLPALGYGLADWWRLHDEIEKTLDETG